MLEDQTHSDTMATSSEFLFEAGKGTSSATVQVNLDAEIELKESLVKMEGKLKAGEKKNLTITTDLGKITHYSTNVLPDSKASKFKAKLDHPIIKEAIDHGGVLFSITSLYEAEHCNVEINLTEKKDESVHAGASAGAGGGGGESVEAGKTAMQGD